MSDMENKASDQIDGGLHTREEMEQEIDKLKQENEELEETNGLYSNCLKRSSDIYKEQHPKENNNWLPDGAKAFNNILEENTKLKQQLSEVKRELLLDFMEFAINQDSKPEMSTKELTIDAYLTNKQ